jgi:16S rRNA (guanine966-N2)-methyltransferase
VRVIAGAYKGRRLKAPSWDGLRPTSDKLRETLFNILAPRIEGARVVDGFAGTGAVGVEALSRGAAHVTFIESDRRAAALIESNLAECRITSGYTIERGDVKAVLDRAGHDHSYDVIVLDPPYGMTGVRGVLAAAAPHLAADGVLVLERSTRNTPDVPPPLRVAREVRSGDSTLTFLSTHERRD